MSEAVARSGARCANCDTPLAGDYCAQCGQSVVATNRTVISLATDFADDAFDWDGRLLRTMRTLYLRPGKVARDYVDGRRARYTPPIRLYLLASLLFFVVVALLNFRFIGVEYEIPDDGPITADSVYIDVRLFAQGDIPPPRPLTAEERASFEASIADTSDLGRYFFNIMLDVVEDPAGVEEAAARGAANALLVVVAAFVLLTALLHPRRRFIEHVVHGLYFHAAHLPASALLLAAMHFTTLLGVSGLPVALGVTGIVVLGLFMILIDRRFYGTTWLGLLWRAPLLLIGYVAAQSIIAVGLTLLTVI